MSKLARSIQIKIRLNEEENKILRKKIEDSRSKSINQFLIRCILEKKIYAVDMQELRKIYTLLAKVSNNINQIAKYSNTLGVLERKEIAYIKKEVSDIGEKLYNIEAFIHKRTNNRSY